MIEDYFQNIVAKVWVGDKSIQNFNMVTSQIEDVFLALSFPEKEIFIGKTKGFYFIVDGIQEDDFKYGSLFLNTDLKKLILGYKDRHLFNADTNIDLFVNNLELHSKLSKKLIDNNVKIKKLKI